MAIAAPTPAAYDAERLIARLGPLLDAPATIAWEPGMRASQGRLGYVRPAEPTRLHVDPDGPHVLETVLHEWIHSLEERGLLPTCSLATRPGGRCTVLARRLAPALAVGAMTSIDLAQPTEELVLRFFRHTGRLPAGYRRTRRGDR